MRDRLTLCDHFAPQYHVGNEMVILFGEIVETSDMLFRNDEKVDRSMGVNIFKYDEGFILIEDLSRLFPSNDLTENAILFHRWRNPTK